MKYWILILVGFFSGCATGKPICHDGFYVASQDEYYPIQIYVYKNGTFYWTQKDTPSKEAE